MSIILGISAYYHDSAACFLKDGVIVYAAQEERFTRKKHDARFPKAAIADGLQALGISMEDISLVAFYEKPFTKFDRLLSTYITFAPRGFKSFMAAMPVWIKEKLWMKAQIQKELGISVPIIFPTHHESHAASAFFPSPFEEAAVLTVDGVGEWTTTSVGVGRGNHLEMQEEIQFPHSLGLLYSAMTYYLGFKVNSGEYKVMGLAPYGEPKYEKLIRDHLIDIKSDGSFRLNLDYFNYPVGLTMTNDKFHKLFGGPPRKSESKLTQKEMDLARSLQVVTEDVMLRIARHIRAKTGLNNLCLAGGVALNCVANGKIIQEGIFENVWIQPAAGDAGGALGAALFAWYRHLQRPRHIPDTGDFQSGSLLGPSFSQESIATYLKECKIPFTAVSDAELFEKTAQLIQDGNVIGWFQGRMEFGPRALGNRSIIGDARSEKMQEVMNLKIKFRESFRPFAPAILREKVSNWFKLNSDSPYMLVVAPVAENIRFPEPANIHDLAGLQKLYVHRSKAPAITHVDYSARVQTVDENRNPRFHALLKTLDQQFGCPLVINTSFNVRGEPIVCTPNDAYRCFMRTHMDYLILGNCILSKKDQPILEKDSDWQKEFELD